MENQKAPSINIEALEKLSPQEKELALCILKEYSQKGESDTLEDLKYSDFEEIPVAIDEFLDNDDYLGHDIWRTDEFTGERQCTLFPYWRNMLHKLFPDNLTTSYNTLILTGAIGLGKAQPLSSLVLTETGYKKMGDLSISDKVFGSDGKLHDILGIFPQGKMMICKVTFSDGTSTLCCDEHLWTVYNIKSKVWKTIKTKELLDHSRNLKCRNDGGNNHRYKIPMTAPIEFAHKNIFVNPYLFGLSLGKAGKKAGGEDLHITDDFLFNDKETRIAVLQGMMDSAGYVGKDGSYVFLRTRNEALKKDFMTLVESLGGTCHAKEYQLPKRNRSIFVTIKLPKAICPFTTDDKKARLNAKAFEPYRYITDVEYVGEDFCQCIYINSEEHLYLTNDFIVTHNTEIAVVAMLYLLYRMLCLKDPYTYYGMMPNDKITFSMLNITLDAAQGVGWDKLQQHIQNSPWFMTHGNLNASRTNPQWQPPKGIELIFGSNNRHIVGRALFCNLTDEVNFGIGSDVEKKKEKQKKMIAQIDARMKSRFMKGTYLPTLNIIISSKDTEQAFLDSYINTKKANESKTTLIIDEPQWVIRNDKGSPNDPGSFYVAVGNKFLAHELLPVGFPEADIDKYREKGYMMLKIPPGFREDFETNLDQALMDIAGLSSSSATKYISGVRLNQAKTEEYSNPFSKDVIEVGNSPDDHTQYANFFDLSKVSPTDMARPLFIHLDMSMTGDKTGIAGVWITGKTASASGKDGAEESSRELRYRTAFSVSVKAPKGYQVSFEKNRNFIRWLRDKGFSIKGISSDTFQSAQIQQDLKSDGFNTKIISVDRVDKETKVCLPYQYLKSAIYEKRILIYKKCDLLTDELIGLERKPDGHIDHTPDGINSKDQADAVCGALYLASGFAEEYSYSYGESLDSALDVNAGESDAYKKRQMIAAFQEELTKAYAGLHDSEEESEQIDPKKKEELESYKDIMDGIIII